MQSQQRQQQQPHQSTTQRPSNAMGPKEEGDDHRTATASSSSSVDRPCSMLLRSTLFARVFLLDFTGRGGESTANLDVEQIEHGLFNRPGLAQILEHTAWEDDDQSAKPSTFGVPCTSRCLPSVCCLARNINHAAQVRTDYTS